MAMERKVSASIYGGTLNKLFHLHFWKMLLLGIKFWVTCPSRYFTDVILVSSSSQFLNAKSAVILLFLCFSFWLLSNFLHLWFSEIWQWSAWVCFGIHSAWGFWASWICLSYTDFGNLSAIFFKCFFCCIFLSSSTTSITCLTLYQRS